MQETRLQSGAAYRSLGFEDENLGSSPGWWANAQADRGNYPNYYLQNLANGRLPHPVALSLYVIDKSYNLTWSSVISCL